MALNPTWSEDKAEKYAEPICIESERRDIDPLIGVAIMRHETNFKPRKLHTNKNGSVDIGLMQFNCRDLDQIHMKWRRRLCDPKRRKYLRTIKGNIYAGFKEMSFWKKACLKKHGDDRFLHSFIDCSNKLSRSNLFIFNILDLLKDCRVCRDCRSVALVPDKYQTQNDQIRLINILKSHWWMRHYNWNSKRHWLSVMYIYKILLEQRDENYVMVNSDYYRKLAKKGKLKKCLVKDDMCLREYEKWQKRRKQK